MIQALLAVLLASTALTDATPSPGPGPTQLSKSVCACLFGISLGDGIDQTFQRLGDAPPKLGQGPPSEYDSYGDLMVGVDFDATAVISISVTALGTDRPKVVDPYGVALGDPGDRLQSLRGKADIVTGNVQTFGPLDGVHWQYTVKDGIIEEIMVSRGAT